MALAVRASLVGESPFATEYDATAIEDAGPFYRAEEYHRESFSLHFASARRASHAHAVESRLIRALSREAASWFIVVASDISCRYDSYLFGFRPGWRAALKAPHDSLHALYCTLCSVQA